MASQRHSVNRPVRTNPILSAAAVAALMLMPVGLSACEPGKAQQPADKGKDSTKPPAKDPAKDKPAEPKLEKVTIAGKEFKLEPALEDQVRFKGLSGREEIKADGGMLFAFANSSPRAFVMRDCPIPIDIIYLDGSGRVTAAHQMKPEPARTEAEKVLSAPYPGAPAWTWTNDAYEARLKQYSSKYSAQFAIELKGGTLETLKVKEGDRVQLDIEGLKKRAQ